MQSLDSKINKLTRKLDANLRVPYYGDTRKALSNKINMHTRSQTVFLIWNFIDAELYFLTYLT